MLSRSALHRLVGHEGQVRAAQDGDGPCCLGRAGCLPGFVDEGRRAGDANHVVRPPLVAGLSQHLGDGIGLDGSVVQGQVAVAGLDQRAGQVAQAHVDVRPRVPDVGLGAGE
jgi:hypothetical protein